MRELEKQSKKPQPEAEAKNLNVLREALAPPAGANQLVRFDRLNHHEPAHATLVQKLDAARDLGEKRVVLAASNVQARLDPRAALPHDDGSTGDELSSECLNTQALRVGVAPVS